MKTIEYNKLIRDRIPEIIEKSGKEAVVEKAEGDHLLDLLNLKLDEELAEYKESGNIEELADLVEVIYGILECKGILIDNFETIRKDKVAKRGAFKEGLVLKKVIEE